VNGRAASGRLNDAQPEQADRVEPRRDLAGHVERRLRRSSPAGPRRHTVPRFAWEHHAAFRQVGERSHERAVADRHVRATAGARRQRGAVADAHRSEHQMPGVEFGRAEMHFATERHVVADLEQVPAAAEHVDAAVQVHALADARAERAQRRALRLGALEQRPRHQAHESHDQPVPQVQPAPRRRAHGAIAADQQFLADHRDPQGDQRVGEEAE
jgi:hypothetical protein